MLSKSSRSSQASSESKVSEVILKGISGYFKAGTSTAIIGPSGSGKTTLLNFLCSQIENSSNLTVRGALKVNGHPVDSLKEIYHKIGYATQEDILYEDFTAKEQLLSRAKLGGIQNPENEVKKVLKWFSLEKCQDTKVGSILKPGLSGGEKRRTSIALEFILNPTVVFLDEPTTGLDSACALDVAKLIKALADNGRTVVSTIHQPSNEILSKFDKVICLCEGRVVYDGEPSKITAYLKELGFEKPANTNPCEHLMRIIDEDDIRISMENQFDGREENDEGDDNIINQKLRKEIRRRYNERLKFFSEKYKESCNLEEGEQERCPEEDLDRLKEKKSSASLFSVTKVLLRRFYLISFRNMRIMVTRFLQVILMGLLDCSIFMNLADPKVDTIRAIKDRKSLTFSQEGSMGYMGAVTSVKGTIPLIPNFKREARKDLYHPLLLYFIATLHELPFHLMIVFSYLKIGWLFLGDGRSIHYFLSYYLTWSLCYLAGSGLADILSYSLQDLQKVLDASAFCITPLYMLSGFLSKIKDSAFYLYYFSYFSFFRFGYQASSNLMFDEIKRERYMDICMVKPAGCFRDEDHCAVHLGSLGGANKACDPMETLDFPEKKFWESISWLIVQVVVFRLIAASIFYYRVARDNVINVEEKVPEEVLKGSRIEVEEASAEESSTRGKNC